jgi:hypothetical protein
MDGDVPSSEHSRRECHKHPVPFRSDWAWLTVEANDQPLDRVAVAELVVRTVEESVRQTEHDKDMVLVDLLCAAWPSRSAQDQ